MRGARVCALLLIPAGLFAQKVLTLPECEQIAIRNHPRIAQAGLIAKATESVIDETRSAYFPTAVANVTSAAADKGTVIAAGALPTSSLSSRGASGLNVSQLVTDFGRTSQLVSSARLRAAAQSKTTFATRSDILLGVDRAYYSTLAANTLLTVVRATVDARRLILRQIQALAASGLKSTLDVSFAEVSVSEAELALTQAENDAEANHTRLSAALGYANDESFELADVRDLATLDKDVMSYVTKALNGRPDLAASQLNLEAAEHLAEAEKRLRYPSLGLIGVAGVLPVHAGNLSGNYAAAGLNISLPILNGGLFSARRAESEFRAQAAGKSSEDLRIQIVMGVRVAWLQANSTFGRLAVAEKLTAQAQTALRLAQTRYDLGLGSIVELTQAQVAFTSAQIAATNAKYEYLTRISELAYSTGDLQ